MMPGAAHPGLADPVLLAARVFHALRVNAAVRGALAA
jgi:hypothetical protein